MYGSLFVFFFGLTETITDTMEYAIATRVGPAKRPQKKLVMCLCKLPLASLGTDCRQRNTYDTRTHETICVWPPLLIHVCKRRLDLAVIRQGIRVTSKMPWHIWWSPECRAGDGFWIKSKSRRARKKGDGDADVGEKTSGRYVIRF